jgi:hypothetical protein
MHGPLTNFLFTRRILNYAISTEKLIIHDKLKTDDAEDVVAYFEVSLYSCTITHSNQKKPQ